LILTAHMDESGTHVGSPTTVMSGAMANARQWSQFQLRLDAMKRKYGFRIFHAKDFKASSGEFMGWSEEKCRAFVTDFGKASAELMEVVTCSLPNSAYAESYRRSVDDPRRLRLDTAYALCFRYSLMHLLMEAFRRLGHHKKFPQTVLHVIAESGHKHAGDAKRVFDEMKRELKSLGNHTLGYLTFAEKDECDPLMLSDFLAYGTFQLEIAGRNELYEPQAPLNRKVTGWTQLTFNTDGLATLKEQLIEGLKKGGGWRVTFSDRAASRTRPAGSSGQPA
jgi:hypothetical protein